MRSHLSKRLSAHLCTVLITAALAAPAALAYEITYDFTASGSFATFTGDGFVTTPGEIEEISGVVTFDVLTEAPPEEVPTDGATWAGGYTDNWVRTDITVTSPSLGILTPVPVGANCGIADDDTGPYYWVEVNNTYSYRSQASKKIYQCGWQSITHPNYSESAIMLHRFSSEDDPWFAGLNFDTGGLSPQYNIVYVTNYWVSWNVDAEGNWSEDSADGYLSRFDIDPASWRVSLAPLAAAAAGLGNPGRGLSQTMNMAQAYYAAGDIESACLMLASFQHQASHAHGSALPQEMSDKLTADSAAVIEALGCN